MMSASTVSGGAASSGYYHAEGYYLEGSQEAEDASQWFGKSAAEHGLVGFVDDAAFAQLLDGDPPNDQGPMGRYVDGERQHRAGTDLTFSAPKSVSVVALVMGDERAVTAHDKAVRAAMAYVEKSVVQTRVWNNGAMETVTGGKIIAGLFRHDTSRALDPQLHTHAVMANMVDTGNGRFTAIHNDQIYRSKKLVTEIYSKELEKGLRAAGYDVSRDRNGLVQIDGIERSVLDRFSKRSQQIAASLNERGDDKNPKLAEMAALATRAAKQGGIDRETLTKFWRSQAAQFGLTKDQSHAFTTKAKYKSTIRERHAARETPSSKEVSSNADEAMRKAIAHVAERRSIYQKNDVLNAGLKFSSGPTNIDDLTRSLDKMIARKEVHVLDGSGNTITDKETMISERALIKTMRADQRSAGVQLARYGRRRAENALQLRLDRTQLTEGQKVAVVTSLTGRERFVGVQGYAGTGKTTMLSRVTSEAEKAGYAVDGLAPSNRAVEALRESVPYATTLQSVLVAERNHPKQTDNAKRVLVVDESSMVSTRDMLTLFKYAERTNYARVVVVGDQKQLDAVEAGSPFRALQTAGMRVATMLDVIRQRNAPKLHSAVLSAIKGDVSAAFSAIGESVQEAPDVASAVSERYLKLAGVQRQKAAVLVLTNAMRGEVNAQIRNGLRSEGLITGKDVRKESLVPLNLSRVEASEAGSYRKGDVVQSLTSNAKLGLSKRALYDVVRVDEDANRVTLRAITGPEPGNETTVAFDGVKRGLNLASFEKQNTPMASGDGVRFRMNDADVGIKNGDRGTIQTITDKEATVRLKSGSTVAVPMASLAGRAMDHDYANTAHALQGQTVERVIVGINAKERLVSQKSFYVAISRASGAAELFTDKPGELAENIAKQTGERADALDTYVAHELEKRREPQTKNEPEKAKLGADKPDRDASKADHEKTKADDEKDRQLDLFKQRHEDFKERADRLISQSEHDRSALSENTTRVIEQIEKEREIDRSR